MSAAISPLMRLRFAVRNHGDHQAGLREQAFRSCRSRRHSWHERTKPKRGRQDYGVVPYLWSLCRALCCVLWLCACTLCTRYMRGRLSTVIRPYTVRFSEIENPTVRFGAVLRKRKSYGAVRCGYQIL